MDLPHPAPAVRSLNRQHDRRHAPAGSGWGTTGGGHQPDDSLVRWSPTRRRADRGPRGPRAGRPVVLEDRRGRLTSPRPPPHATTRRRRFHTHPTGLDIRAFTTPNRVRRPEGGANILVDRLETQGVRGRDEGRFHGVAGGDGAPHEGAQKRGYPPPQRPLTAPLGVTQTPDRSQMTGRHHRITGQGWLGPGAPVGRSPRGGSQNPSRRDSDD